MMVREIRKNDVFQPKADEIQWVTRESLHRAFAEHK
jgi:hypothetical protein